MVPVVSYVTTNVVPRAIPGAIPASPLVPAGHSVVYYDEVSHSGSEPKDQKDQRPDESQVHELVQSPDEQQSQERPAIPVPAAPLPALLPESPVAASPVEPAAESSGEEQPAADSYDTEDGAGNDQPAVAVPEEEPVDGPPVPQEMRRRVVESKIRETPQTQDQGQEEDVPQVPQVPPQQEVKGVKRPQYPAKGGVKGQRPIVTPHPLPPARRRPVVPEQSIKGQAPLPEAAPVPHLPKHGSKGGRRRVPVVPAVDEAPLPQVPQVPQAVRGGVKGGQQQQEAKGQRPVQVPEQSVKGQAPAQVPADESPEALAPAAKGGRRRIQVLPQVPVAEEEEVPQAPQQAVKGVKGGQQQQEETKGHDHPHPAKRIPRPQRGGVKGGQQQQQEEVQDQAVKG